MRVLFMYSTDCDTFIAQYPPGGVGFVSADTLIRTAAELGYSVRYSKFETAEYDYVVRFYQE